MRLRFSGADRGTSRRPASPRAAITLVEMLVAMAITLLLMASVVQVFDLLGTAVAGSRATMEMTDQLRQAQTTLHSDLAAISRPVVPWVTDEEGGYFEYIEGTTTANVTDLSELTSGPTPPGDINIDNGGSGFSTSGFVNYTQAAGSNPSCINSNHHASNGTGHTATWTPNIPLAGPYNVTLSFLGSTGLRSGAVPVTIQHAGGTTTATCNQVTATLGRASQTYGPFNFNVGASGFLRVASVGSAAYVSGDQVTFSWAGTISTAGIDQRLGDFDDGLLFTARSAKRPFQGRLEDASGNVSMIESLEAEIVWACFQDGVAAGDPEIRTVYRRVLLIAPWAPVPAADLNLGIDAFQDKHDLSARQEGGKIVLNTIQDLALRQNRYRHASAFPHACAGYRRLTGAREGEDVVLRNALAFDVRIFDPGAPLFNYGGVGFGPADPGYVASNVTAATVPDGFGAYVDLGTTWLSCNVPSGAPSSDFMLPAQTKSGLVRTFDTWPAKYESDGVDQDGGTTGVDQASDGFAVSGAVDVVGERETSAPYLATPTGIQVKLRAYESDARQIREVTVQQNLVP